MMRRPLTWVILAWNALAVVWLIGGLVNVSNDAGRNCAGQPASCQQGQTIGVIIGVFLILGVAAFGDVILGVIWHVTRRQPERDGGRPR